MRFNFFRILGIWTMLLACPAWLGTAWGEERLLRVGFFPNVTHAHALIAQNMAAEGKGWYESRLPGVRLSWYSFNAGPSAMESMFAGAIDLTYVGPNPALNAYLRSQGGLAVLAGAVRGGAGLVVPAASGLAAPADFKGLRIATPQLGNTQDIACRWWLDQAGIKTSVSGGEVRILPVANPEMLALFIKGEIDAAWTVEPWVSRLEMEGNGKLVYAEPAETSLTTILAAGSEQMRTDPELFQKFAAAHRELTEWIKNNPEEAQQRTTAELSRLMRREFPPELTRHAWPRLIFANGISREDFDFSLRAAQTAGFVKSGNFNLENLVVAP
ncbi:MAG: ABC transporter substrate-binding protein [Deltaproteobacteria bacterium]|jgi:NitT/TauT family transport system substrate-binding protein|nr:ABC transporter substrate-binding protein [Deltaproteobacteria bacterium]